MNNKKVSPGKKASPRVSPRVSPSSKPSSKRGSPTTRFDSTGAGKRLGISSPVANNNLIVYFDPRACGKSDTLGSSDWGKENLYQPVSVIKEIDGIYTVKLPTGEITRLNGSRVSSMNKQDNEGIPDILSLDEFSEMSFVHSVRTRYKRDEIYTFVGPILISINPYKSIKNMYAETMMAKYHNSSSPFSAVS